MYNQPALSTRYPHLINNRGQKGRLSLRRGARIMSELDTHNTSFYE